MDEVILFGDKVEVPEISSEEDIRELAEELGLEEDEGIESVTESFKEGNITDAGVFLVLNYEVKQRKDVEEVEFNDKEDIRDYIEGIGGTTDDEEVEKIFRFYTEGILDKESVIAGALESRAVEEQRENIDLLKMEGD